MTASLKKSQVQHTETPEWLQPGRLMLIRKTLPGPLQDRQQLSHGNDLSRSLEQTYAYSPGERDAYGM